MSKREHTDTNLGDTEGSKTKRRKHDGSAGGQAISTAVASGSSGTDSALVKEQGLKLWQIVKDHTNKEGRILSPDFVKKPPKKFWPDYYQIIARPIALEDIKKRLDSNGYASLEDVRADFELCFTNAKTYNMKDSAIWRDAKDLLKVTNKAYNKMLPSDENSSKAPNMHRMLKSRLQKVVEMTDDTGRVLSTQFMELVSRKEWPIYYEMVKKPECLEAIFKRLKRKEYTQAADFATDVELVFSNALSFNQEHTVIWEDALALRDYFRQLMVDLPEPFALPQYSKPEKNKIKIKMPAAVKNEQSAAPVASSSSVTLRVPASATASALPPTTAKPPAVAAVVPKAAPSNPPTKPTVETPAPVAPAVPVAAPESGPVLPIRPAPIVIQQVMPLQPQQHSFVTTFHPHYPNATYSSPVVPLAAPKPVLATPARQVTPAAPPYSGSNTPAPQLPLSHQLQGISLKLEPSKRTIRLEHTLGVKSFALQLVRGETSFFVRDIRFLADPNDDEPESSADEDEDEDGDVDMDEKKKIKRGRGRPSKKSILAMAKAAATAAKPSSRSPGKKRAKLGDIQVKLNGTALTTEEVGNWLVDIPVGYHTIEVGELGGMIWKVYAERLS